MAIVLDRSHRWRIIAAHAFLIGLCALVIFPFLMILSISLRPGSSMPRMRNSAVSATAMEIDMQAISSGVLMVCAPRISICPGSTVTPAAPRASAEK